MALLTHSLVRLTPIAHARLECSTLSQGVNSSLAVLRLCFWFSSKCLPNSSRHVKPIQDKRFHSLVRLTDWSTYRFNRASPRSAIAFRNSVVQRSCESIPGTVVTFLGLTFLSATHLVSQSLVWAHDSVWGVFPTLNLTLPIPQALGQWFSGSVCLSILT